MRSCCWFCFAVVVDVAVVAVVAAACFVFTVVVVVNSNIFGFGGFVVSNNDVTDIFFKIFDPFTSCQAFMT